MSDAGRILAEVRRAGIRVTEPRRRVAQLVAHRSAPFSAADLVADARASGTGLGRATVFRAIDLLVSLDVLERIDLPAGGHAYVVCEPAHHHHLICTACGRATEVEDCGMGDVAAEMARRTGFRVDAHRLELFGTCPGCLASRSA